MPHIDITCLTTTFPLIQDIHPGHQAQYMYPVLPYFPLFTHISYCNNSLVLHWNNLLSIFKNTKYFSTPTYRHNFFYLFSSLSKGRGILPLIIFNFSYLHYFKNKILSQSFFQTILIFEQFSIPFFIHRFALLSLLKSFVTQSLRLSL